MSMFAKHSRCIRFITLLIPLFLVCVGTRVPDFSRPHKPKPLRRAVLDKSSARTIAQSVVKVAVDPVITNHPTLALLSAVDFLPEVHPIYLPVPLLSLSPLPPRAPPVSSPLA
jgi:hypothetical protein